jgi:hypothetical protein
MYRLEETRQLKEDDPPILVPKGELVADAVYFNLVPHAPRGFAPAKNATTVRLQQVILANLLLCSKVEGAGVLPNLCNNMET